MSVAGLPVRATKRFLDCALLPKNALTEAKDMQERINLQAQNKSVRQIADETGFAPTTVHRKLRKAAELGYKPTPCSVPFHTGVEQTEQLFK